MDKLEFKTAFTVDDAGTVTGIAWPFGSPDRVGDLIEKGAFSLPDRLPMLWSHDQSQVVGVWEQIAETPEGLTVKGRLMVDTVARAREVHALVREQAISGLSIGFVTKTAKARHGGGRTISALDLREISIVAVPSHPGATITSIKAASDGSAPVQKDTPMENEAVETKTADPVVTPEEMAALRTRLDKIEAKSQRPTGANNNHPAADNDNGDLETKAYGEYLRKGDQMALETKAALTVANESQAGYLAPEMHGGEVVKLLREYSPIRQYARVITVGGTSIKYPRRTGSTEAFWTAESAARTSSDMAFEQIGITPHELATYVDLSRALAEDNAYDLAGELNSDLAESFAMAEGRAFIAGTGVGQPKGLLHPDNLLDFQKIETTIGTATADADVIIDMYHAIPQVFAERGVWLMNLKTLGALRKVKNANGDYILVADMTTGMKSTILGRPVIVMPDMPDLAAGEAGAILFGDLQGYRVTDRVSFAMLVDPYSRATHGEIRYHARRRVGADVTHPDRFAFFKAAA